MHIDSAKRTTIIIQPLLSERNGDIAVKEAQRHIV